MAKEILLEKKSNLGKASLFDVQSLFCFRDNVVKNSILPVWKNKSLFLLSTKSISVKKVNGNDFVKIAGKKECFIQNREFTHFTLL